MPSSIFFTDKQKAQIVEAAKACGFRVSRGRSSQLALFVVEAAVKVSSERSLSRAVDGGAEITIQSPANPVQAVTAPER